MQSGSLPLISKTAITGVEIVKMSSKGASMPVKRLTEEGIARLKAPAGKQIDYRDAVMPGLVLRVNYGGAKIWRAAHRTDGKGGKRFETATRIGRWPHLRLTEAREAARGFLAGLTDPKAFDGGTFEQVMDQFLEQHVKARGLRTARHIEWSLRTCMLPFWAARPFAAIKRADVTELLNQIERKHGSRTADICLSHLRGMMDYYAIRHGDFVSPLVRKMGRYNAADHRRARTLDEHEIRALWQAAGELGSYGAMVKTLLLTAQRLGDVRAMRRADVVDGTWDIPELDRAKRTGGVLRLPKVARDLIAEQPHIRGEDRVFPISGLDARKQRLDRLMRVKLGKLPGWRLHDLRRTARTLMGAAKVPRDDAERVLGHRVGSVVAETYDRFAYVAEKQQALAKLAALANRGQSPWEGRGCVRAAAGGFSRLRPSQGVLGAFPGAKKRSPPMVWGARQPCAGCPVSRFQARGVRWGSSQPDSSLAGLTRSAGNGWNWGRTSGEGSSLAASLAASPTERIRRAKAVPR
jgi:integrase